MSLRNARDAGQHQAARLKGRVPGTLRLLVERAAGHHTLTLAAGLAFFGIISIGPAIGFGLGVMRLVTSPEAATSMVDTLQGAFTETLGIGDLLDQMEDQAARYAGLSLLVLLWPATTMASGWTRALDAVNDAEPAGGLRGLRGRLRGLLLGGVLLAGFLLLLGVTTAGTVMAEEPGVLLAALAVVAVAGQFLFCLLIYRVLPSTGRPWRGLWRGAALATGGVVLATVAFALLLGFADDFADQYPPTLSTAVVLGLWLYAANLALLLGDEYNAARAAR